jgi:holin-like protein
MAQWLTPTANRPLSPEFPMLEALSTLLAFQLLGEALSHALALPIPGPVIGLVALFFAWPHLRGLQQDLASVSSTVLGHLGLLFVPAGVGVMLHVGLIAAWWAPLLLALVLSTLVTVCVVALLFTRWARL